MEEVIVEVEEASVDVVVVADSVAVEEVAIVVVAEALEEEEVVAVEVSSFNLYMKR